MGIGASGLSQEEDTDEHVASTDSLLQTRLDCSRSHQTKWVLRTHIGSTFPRNSGLEPGGQIFPSETYLCPSSGSGRTYCGSIINNHGLQAPRDAKPHQDVKHIASDGVRDCHVSKSWGDKQHISFHQELVSGNPHFLSEEVLTPYQHFRMRPYLEITGYDEGIRLNHGPA